MKNNRLLKVPFKDMTAAIKYRSKTQSDRSLALKAQIHEMMVSTNMTYQQIGDAIGISGQSVYYHVKRMVQDELRKRVEVED